jgi:glyoxylase-like metal-dependent hydrolase (beta-lactamase superfamily II)
MRLVGRMGARKAIKCDERHQKRDERPRPCDECAGGSSQAVRTNCNSLHPFPPPLHRGVGSAVAGSLRDIATDSQIYLIRRPDALRQPVEGNVTFIVNEQDVVVVDGGGSPLAATNAIRLIRSVTDKPVSTLITTHWHGDHNLGNQVYRATFPMIRIISHENTEGDVPGAAGSSGHAGGYNL